MNDSNSSAMTTVEDFALISENFTINDNFTEDGEVTFYDEA